VCVCVCVYVCFVFVFMCVLCLCVCLCVLVCVCVCVCACVSAVRVCVGGWLTLEVGVRGVSASNSICRYLEAQNVKKLSL
jgi:hypothetical protein